MNERETPDREACALEALVVSQLRRDRDPDNLDDLPELSDAERAAMTALGSNLIEKLWGARSAEIWEVTPSQLDSGARPVNTTSSRTFIDRAVRRWWKIAMPVGVGLAAAALAYFWLTFMPVYRATAWLEITPPYDIYIVTPDIRNSSERSFIQAQAQLLRSQPVLVQVIANPEIARMPQLVDHPAPENYLADRISINASSESSLFIINYDDIEPNCAARILNAIVEAFFKMQSSQDAGRMQRLIELLSDEQSRRTVIIKSLRENIKEMKREQWGLDEDEDMDTLRYPASRLAEKITTTELDKEILKAHYKESKEYFASLDDKDILFPDKEIEDAVNNDPKVQRIVERQNRLREQQKVTSALAYGGTDSPQYRQVEQELANLDKELDTLRDTLKEKIREKKKEDLMAENNASLKRMAAHINTTELELKLMKERYHNDVGRLIHKAGPAMEISFKLADLDREEHVVDAIAGRISHMKTEMRAPPKIRSLRKATPPTVPANALPYRQMWAASVSAILAPFLVALVWEGLTRRRGRN